MQTVDTPTKYIEGIFVQELKNIRLRFRGSENQRIIDVAASLKAGEVIELII